MNEALIFPHVAAGVFGLLAAAALLTEHLSGAPFSALRTRLLTWFMTVNFFLSGMLGGFWYLSGYPESKEVIKAGPWPWAHGVVMETKEHLFLLVPMLCVVALACVERAAKDKLPPPRNLMVGLMACILTLSLLMEVFGGMISMAVRVGLAGA